MDPAADPAAGPATPTVAGPTTSADEGTGSLAGVHSRPVAVLLFVLLALVWGVHWAVVKVGLEVMPPLTYGTLRLAGGLATVVAVMGVQGRLERPARGDLPVVISIGLGQIACAILIINAVIVVVGAGRSSVLQFTMPLWVAAISILVFRIRPKGAEAAALGLGIVGLVVLFNPASVDWDRPGELTGMLALLANAVLWAGVTIHIRRHSWRSSPGVLQPWQLLVALVPVAVAAFAIEGFNGVRWGPSTVLILLYSGPLATAFGFWASQAVTRALGPLASGIGFLAVPVVGLVSGAVFLGEQLGPLDVAGFTLVLGGVAIASVWPAAKARETG